MKRVTAVVAPLVVAAVAMMACALEGAQAGPSTATVTTVDRTLVCSTISFVGERMVQVFAQPTIRDIRTAFMYVSAVGRTKPNLASVNAAGPNRGIGFNERMCNPSRQSVPLTQRGIAGAAILYNRSFDCPATRRVVVRVRAVLSSWRGWFRHPRARYYPIARGPVAEGSLAVRKYPGLKPIAFVQIDRSGVSRLFVSQTCR